MPVQLLRLTWPCLPCSEHHGQLVLRCLRLRAQLQQLISLLLRHVLQRLR
jgi:hypothetical protein